MAKSTIKSASMLDPDAKFAASLAATPAQKPLADGIYIGLSSERYHADPALGSSNIRDLRKGANLFWHKSRMNPLRPREKKTPSKILGTAVHRLLLDGDAAFRADYVRGPYGPDDDHLTSAEKSSLTKAAKGKLVDGQELLTQEDYDFVLGCKEVLDRDPDLQGCLDSGLSEVSIFWTRKDGVRCKARIDKLKIRGIGDLKTIANERERPLDQACLLDISTYRYDIPVAHYSEGRRQMAKLLNRGDVFIGDGEVYDAGKVGTEVLDFLCKCAAQESFGFQLVFIPKQGAPDAWSCTITPVMENPIYAEACVDVEAAITTYKAALAKYGTSRWLPGHAVEEVTPDMLPYGFGRRKPAGTR